MLRFSLDLRQRVLSLFGFNGAFPKNFFGHRQRSSAEHYFTLWERAKLERFPEVESFERETGFSIDREWVEALALQTQVVKKNSSINWQHGRVLYAALSSYFREMNSTGDVTLFETGTARGFSAITMARAIADAGMGGKVISLDFLPHNTPMMWNSISDAQGPQSRRDLLSDWRSELERVIFVQGWSGMQMARLGIERIHFAFLDGAHTYADVMGEFEFVDLRQEVGDVVVFDDVSAIGQADVVRAVKDIEKRGRHQIRRLESSMERGYAIATKI